jgi:phospholipase/carboxylesterase
MTHPLSLQAICVALAICALPLGALAQDETAPPTDTPVDTAPPLADLLDPPPLPEVVVVEAPACFGVPVHLPEGYDPARTYPLVVGLHGYASSPGRFNTLYYAFDDPQFIYAAPQAPYALPMGSALGYSWFLETDEDELLEQVKQVTIGYVLAVIDDLSSRYQVSEVYLLGFSQGAILSYMTGASHPERVAGLICLGSPFSETWFQDGQLNAASSLPVFIGYGVDDPFYGEEAATGARDALESLGFDVTLHAYDEGHNIPPEALKVIGKWLVER